MTERDTPDALQSDLRTDWHRYVDSLVPLRPALFAYCRRLTGTVWDAEDLTQDTLIRAFGRWGVTRPQIRHPRTYLLRTATNVWIDLQRRRATEARSSDALSAEPPRARAPRPRATFAMRALGSCSASHLRSRQLWC